MLPPKKMQPHDLVLLFAKKAGNKINWTLEVCKSERRYTIKPKGRPHIVIRDLGSGINFSVEGRTFTFPKIAEDEIMR